jgi:hypothetical protein
MTNSANNDFLNMANSNSLNANTFNGNSLNTGYNPHHSLNEINRLNSGNSNYIALQVSALETRLIRKIDNAVADIVLKLPKAPEDNDKAIAAIDAALEKIQDNLDFLRTARKAVK